MLGAEAKKYGIDLSENQLGLFQIYLDELWAWSQRTNLTGLSSRKRIAFELFLDSLIPAPFLAKRGTLLDAGTGAGLPGIPLKIYSPRLDLHLLDANFKKGSFLKHAIRLLGVGETVVITERVEDAKDSLLPQGYHIITARALSRFGQALTWCAPKLAPGGFLVSYLGGQAETELRENKEIIDEHHLVLYKHISYTLPGMDSTRMAVIFKNKEGSHSYRNLSVTDP
ncbi:MAG: 16S rRNA (guanine(527)-N(7))-methyltransferase RsmG [Deltaproteobacteria bacterium]|nr:16S rRNA (guanine(527)-N(7))-methyltransferase RsmG [Deltaproteobacteria bacterium]